MLNFSSNHQDPITVLCFIGLLSSLYSFCSQRKHLISTLLSLEGAVLALFVLISYWLIMSGSNSSFIMTFLTLAVCEAALGLMILVLMVRSHSNDFLSSMNII